MDRFIDFYKNKKIGFVGLGVSNLPILELFISEKISVTVRDKKEKSDIKDYDKLREMGAVFFTGDDYLSNIDEDVLFLSPALRPDVPEFIDAQKNGTLITTELEEFLKYCPCTTIGITGSDGKTTTSTLCAKLLEASGKNVYLGGNIGENLFVKLPYINADDFAVIEISSFQLMKMSRKPNVSIVTNVSPNHLDWHKGMDEYIEAKKKIVSKENGRSVLNGDDKTTLSFATPNSIFFGTNKNCQFRFSAEGIYADGELILKDEDILLPGIHNRANYSAAIAAVYPFVTKDAILKVAKNFGGVEHRIELVGTKHGVTYYNSSIDTSPTRTAAALNSFKDKLIVIAGGYDKKIPLDSLGELFERKAKAVILMGATAPKIEKILYDCNYSGKIFHVENMSEAVVTAQKISIENDKVILSPAAASFDKYPNFAARGKDFKEQVNSIK